MLSDDERRTLEATAALLRLDDPALAAQLDQHRLAPRRRWRIPLAAWPPLLVITLCLTLLIVPGLAVDGRASAPTPTSRSSTQPPHRSPAVVGNPSPRPTP